MGGVIVHIALNVQINVRTRYLFFIIDNAERSTLLTSRREKNKHNKKFKNLGKIQNETLSQ